MHDENKNYTIVFNGEIYNYREEKIKLLEEGYKFQTESDTEVLLNLYIKYGINCLERLNGCFAFAIYNKREKSLFLARDRYGINPLVLFLF